ncbi:MAG: trypsin-like peptidase domain-containing protein [Dehalococcoidia bacterium]
MGGKSLGIFSAIVAVVAILLVRNMLNVETSAPEIAEAPEAPPVPGLMETAGPPPSPTLSQVPPDESVLLWLRPVVVQVKTDLHRGSGILIDTAGNVVTNSHVVEGSSGIAVVFEDGREVTAEVWATDKSLDLAVLRIAGATPVAEVWGDSSDVQVGDEIMALGFPRELGGSITVTKGTVSAIRPPFLQTDMAIDPGNSGGPLVNMEGKVIGITAWKAVAAGKDPADGIAFAIPANEIRQRLSGQIAWPLQTLIPVTDPPSVTQISREQTGVGASLILDAANNTHAVWSEKIGADFQIEYSVRGPKGFWAMPRNISNSPVWAGAPSAVVDTEGTVHVAWHEHSSANADRYDVFYANKRAGQEWSAPANISQTGGLSRDPILTGDSRGTLHIVWSEGLPGDRSMVYSQRPGQGIWSEHKTVPGTGKATIKKGLIIDREGTVFLAWNDGGRVYVSQKPEGASWGLPEPVSIPSMHSLNQEIAIDQQDVVHLGWEVWKDGAARILHRQRRADGQWSSSIYLSGKERSARGVRLAVDPNGRLHTLWLRDPDPDGGMPSVMLSCQPTGGSASKPGVIREGQGSELQAIAVDESGVIHALVWGAVEDRGVPSIRYVMVPALCG